MSKIAKTIFLVCVALGVLGALALLATNLYLQSEAVQNRAGQAASQSLGVPVVINQIFFTPWSGLVASGIEIQDAAYPDEHLLKAKCLRLRPRLLPLLFGRLEFTEARLEEPLLIARQTPDAQWAISLPPPPSRQISVPIQEPPPDSERETGAKKPAGEKQTDERKQPAATEFKATIHSIRIAKAKLLLIDRKGNTLLRIENATLRTKMDAPKIAKGSFTIPSAKILQTLRPHDLKGSFTWDGDLLSIPDIKGSLAGGTLNATFSMQTSARPTFQATAAVQGSELAKLAEELGSDPSSASGTLNGALHLQGQTTDTNTFDGTGHLEILDGRLRPVYFLVQAGKIFGIPELQMLELREASSHFVISGPEVVVNPLTLRTENLILTSLGTVGFDGRLALNATLSINKKLQKQLASRFRRNFQPTDDPEYKKLDFTVSNTLSKPRTDLLDKLLGIQVGEDLGQILRSIIGRPAPKKTSPSATPPASQSPTPPPPPALLPTAP